jgi:hypothetical protein
MNKVASSLASAWGRVPPLMVVIFQGFVDRVTTYPLVEVVARCDAWKLEFRGSRVAAMLGGALGFRNNPYFWSFSPYSYQNFEKCGSHKHRQL